jgi:hypothetical protein
LQILLGNNHVALKVDAHLHGFAGLGRCAAPDAISVFGKTGNVGEPTSLVRLHWLLGERRESNGDEGRRDEKFAHDCSFLGDNDKSFG